ncbi:6-phosphogluconolactonase [Aliiglaciecola lipolytica]|uniref:6-phosphogluconolactonase n=1 Tax=Aliiglaciecola lipolytica E3 TaxID=1127673 RepID=K6Y8N3_9ALTE|nr:6-phosphogluconolactonase [Aliiglaciecola lipolytica]GAC14567.1 6-phosphogluconolactonase [Aliiglaciecola lipolytica E3]
MALIENCYSSIPQLNEAFSAEIANILKAGIEANGRASLAVSGGRTPAAMFNQLSNQSLDWSKVDVTLVDERWVDEDDPASNAAMAKRELLINKAAAAQFYGLKTAESDAVNAVAELNAQLVNIQTPFDVLILGMGEDGHTASLFPCSKQLEQGLNTDLNSDYIAVTPTTAPNQRMSLTLKSILNSKNIFLHLTGEPKKHVLDIALQSDNALEMPIRAVFNNADVKLIWAA